MDRTSMVGTIWLGLTVGCARCHDHKYDSLVMSVFQVLHKRVTMEAFGSNSWKSSEGTDRYRRGLYTLILRTSPFTQGERAIKTACDSPGRSTSVDLALKPN